MIPTGIELCCTRLTFSHSSAMVPPLKIAGTDTATHTRSASLHWVPVHAAPTHVFAVVRQVWVSALHDGFPFVLFAASLQLSSENAMTATM